MQKLKSFKFSGILSILKCVLIGVIATLIGIIIFSIVLKFANLSNLIISYVNDVIKVFSIFIMISCIKKCNPGRLLVKAILSGIMYAFVSLLIFSILNGSFVFNMSFVYDLLFAIIVSVIVSIIVNVLSRRNV